MGLKRFKESNGHWAAEWWSPVESRTYLAENRSVRRDREWGEVVGDWVASSWNQRCSNMHKQTHRHVWKRIRDREAGKLHASHFANRIKWNRISQLQLSNHKDIVSPHKGAINSLQIDSTEGRYLLSAASDASVAVYDVQRPTVYEAGGVISKHSSIFVVDKQHQQAHKYAVSSAIWYPIDTGLFVTGSYDHHINVWDTNTTQVFLYSYIIG